MPEQAGLLIEDVSASFFRSDSMQRSLKSMVIFNVPLQLL